MITLPDWVFVILCLILACFFIGLIFRVVDWLRGNG